MPKYDPEVVLEFYANAWPTEEGVLYKRSNEQGQWIPYDIDVINQFLGNPLILEEGQQYEYTSRRGRTTGFDEEAIGQLLGFPGRDFIRNMAGKQLQIMHTNMTTYSNLDDFSLE